MERTDFGAPEAPAAETLETAFERTLYALARDASFAGVDVVTHAVRRHGRSAELEVMVDRAGGVDLQLCERVAAYVNTALEARTETYVLQVESPGIDRPLLRAADYERALGANVKIVTTLPIDNQKTHRGTLAALRGSNAVLATPRGELPIPLELVKSANVEYDYRADLKRAKTERRDAVAERRSNKRKST